MSFSATIMARDSAAERAWAEKLRAVADQVTKVQVSSASSVNPTEYGQMVFVDAHLNDLDGALARIERKGRAVFLIADEMSPLPRAFVDGKVDDVLVYPFRTMEFLSKVFRFQQVLLWEEVGKLNTSFTDLIGRLQDDLKLAERLQKSKLPVRFPEIKGFKVSTRYLAGMRSGGDYLDLAESPDKNLISMVLTDSSSYGLSSAVLSILMKVVMKLSFDETRSSVETVRRIQEELLVTLGEKDKLSLFYGVVSRKDYKLRYVNLGTSCAFYARPKSPFEALPSSGGQITLVSGPIGDTQSELVLDPEGKLVLLSDGFVEAAGGLEKTVELLNRFRERDAVEALNEMVYKVKEKFEDPEEDMPPQDCTAAAFDIEARLIRLASV